MSTILSGTEKTENIHYFSGMLKSLDSACRTCNPVTPLECLTRCKVYRVKNELRRLQETLHNPDYITELFNVLKNDARLYVLQVLLNGRYSISQLQLDLKKVGHNYCQSAIIEEYLRPLATLGLVGELQGEHYLTLFGSRLTKQLGHFPKFVHKLPARSECCEEVVLQHLLSESKTFESIEAVISLRNVSRTLKRLRSSQLIETSSQRDYVFFFKTIRDPNKESLTTAERRIYNELSLDGISAGKLAIQTGFSTRVVYKCIKRLRGKKLLFQRKTPKTYHLTVEGKKLAAVLHGLQQTVQDTWVSFQQVSPDNATTFKVDVLS